MQARRWSIALGLAVTIALATGAPAGAQPRDEPGRACTAGDLVGTWDMQGMSVAKSEKVDAADTWFFPHQRFVFTQDGSVKHLSSSKPLPAADAKAIAAMPATSTWSLDPRGYLTVHGPKGSKPQESLCSFLVRDMPGPTAPKRGDVLLSYMRGTQPIVQKLLRKAK